MRTAADPLGRLRRARAGWLTAQLLLGVGLARPTQVVVIVAVVCLAALAAIEPTARPMTTVFVLVVVVVSVAPTIWPLPALTAGAVLLIWSRLAGQARGERHPRAQPYGSPWRRLRLGLGVGVVSAIIVTPIAVGFVDGAPLAFPVQRPPAVLIYVLVVAAAALNTFAEEALWRGAIVAADQRLGVTARSTVVVQAVGFGVAHWHGIPGGPMGVLAAALFGATMAWLRLRAGLSAALVAHFLTDVAIFSIVAATAVFVPA